MSFVRKSYKYLVFYIFWEFIISNGRHLGTPAIRYFFFIFTFLIFLVCLFKTKKILLTSDGQLWVPFFLWTIIGSFYYVVPGIMFIWGTAFIVTLISIGSNIKVNFPYKWIFYFGIIQIIGQILQIETPSTYGQFMSFLYGPDYREYGSGLQGFATNTGTTSVILMYTLGTYLYFIAPKKNYIFNALIIITIVVFIVLTGKRSSSFIVLSIPMLVLFISSKSKSAFINYFFPSLCAIFIFLYVFSTNLDRFDEIRGMEKVSHGLEMFLGEEEVDLNGREELWEAAIEGYRQNPMFGIGVSQFQKWSGYTTNPHNMYLQILCEQGIAGLTLFILPLIFCLFHTIYLLRKSKENAPFRQTLKYSLFIQLYFTIYGLSGNPTRNAYGYMMYFCAIGILQNYLYSANIPNSINKVKNK